MPPFQGFEQPNEPGTQGVALGWTMSPRRGLHALAIHAGMHKIDLEHSLQVL